MSVNYMNGEAYSVDKQIYEMIEDTKNSRNDISTYMLFESIKNHFKLRNLSSEDYQSRIKKIADALDI